MSIMSTMRFRRESGDLENSIMDIVWDAGGWATPREVCDNPQLKDASGKPLAYTTVMTVMTRLWKKGRLERIQDGRSYAYRSTETREQHLARRMEEILSGSRDRTAALTHFVGSLDSSERDIVAKLVRRLHRSGHTTMD
ncbi:MAG: BlaI/MecI/CopY family transcriptional regulator [Actinobacteria bacterium]|nr:BlaI/MecI/CopY family transcriptional regulator [Actinomycetota bacterium]MCL5885677.1 BlaI/MecI/CopY family transcriptional regulator [Actinomycetota bacterium]